MTDLLTEAQIAATATLLHVDPAELSFLEQLDTEQVVRLREDIAASFFDEEAAAFARVSRLAPVVPDRVVGSVSERVVPPLVAGRVSGALALDHPDRIGSVLGHVSAEYMADCAPHLDHRIIPVISDGVDAATFVPAAHVLLDRGDHVTAALFVDAAPLSMAGPFEAAITDDRALLVTVAMVPDTDKMRAVVDAFPERVQRIMRGAGCSCCDHHNCCD